MYKLLTKLYPARLKKELYSLVAYCNIATNLERYTGLVIIASVIVGILIALLMRIFLNFPITLLIPAGIILVHSSIFAYLTLSADARAKFVEDLLPDALQLMSANLRAGMTIDRALLLAARPEFGQFQDEINRVGKEITTGKDFSDALTEMASRYKSEKLQKTIQLIVSGVASGGSIADLLQQTAGNLRQQKLTEQRIRANVLVYVIFIFSAIGFGAPMLFSLSSFLIEVITDIFSKIQLPPATVSIQLPLSFSKVSVTPQFINTYTITSLMITSVLGSLILGLIARGKEKEGLKFLPILILLTLSLFFLIKFLIRNLLGGLFSI